MPDARRQARLAIVGGGAAGMFAAAVAAELGVPCVLFERKARLGSKMLMTANGRCNFTKDIPPDRFITDLSCGGLNRACSEFAAAAIRACPPSRIARGFQSLGVRLKRMPDGRMFPADGKAATIVHAFGDLLRDESVPIVSNCPVTGISRTGTDFVVETRNFSLAADSVILATGGVSYPKTGSVGDGQNFARRLGHAVTPYRPGLIGVETDDPAVKRLAGRRFEDGHAAVRAGAGARDVLFRHDGEIDCESFGLSGAAVYNAQRFIEHYRRERGNADGLVLDASFGGIRVRCAAPRARPLKEAIVTIGGVDTSEIDPRTMESRIVPGLFFAGEVMDIDGPTGGYNITLAFATARLAVACIAAQRSREYGIIQTRRTRKQGDTT